MSRVTRVCARRGLVVGAAASLLAVAGAAVGDEVRVVATAGNLVPGGGGSSVRLNRFSGFPNAYLPVISPSGHVVYMAEIAGTGVTTADNQGMWRVDPRGNTSLVARVGRGAWAPSSTTYFASLASPMIDAAGGCAFQSFIGGGTTGSTASVWGFDGGSPQLLTRAGESPAGVSSGAVIGSFAETYWFRNRSNQPMLLFKSMLSGGVTTTNNRAICVDSASASSVSLTQAGERIAELPGLTCREPYRSGNVFGESVLYATLMGAGIVSAGTTPVVPNDQVIWRPGAANTWIARAGQVATGGPSGLRFSSLFQASSLINRPQVGATGAVAFTPTLCDAAGVAIGSGIWVARGGELAPAVVSGDSIPGVTGATVAMPIAPVTQFGYRLCDNDDVVCVSLLTGVGVGFGTDRALLRIDSSGRKELLVRGGQQAPGAPAGVYITNDSIGRCWRSNAMGDIAFVASLAGPGVTAANDVAVFSTRGGALHMIAREGQAIPGCADWRLANLNTDAPLYLNNLGQVVFSGVADHADTGLGAIGTWFRVDRDDTLWPLIIGTEIVPNQTGQRVRFSAVSTLAQMTLTDAGEVVVLSSLMPGGDVVGDSVVVIRIAPAQVATGACCVDRVCSTVPATACAGTFRGADTTCSAATVCCPADVNGVDGVTVDDLFDFLRVFFVSDPAADFNHSGAVGVQDVFDFLAAYLAGC